MKKQITILLVEDNIGDARLIEEMLRESRRIETSCSLAQSLQHGMDLLREKTFDVILLDLGLPDSTGLPSLEQIQTINKQTPVIIMTGLDDEETGVQAMVMGAQDYVIKGSVGPESIERVIRYAIERKRSEAELQSHLTFLKTLINTIPNPVFYKDINGKYLGCNDTFADYILGMKKNELIGRSILEITDRMPADKAKRYHQDDLDLIKTGGAQFFEAPIQTPDGGVRDFFFNKAVYRNPAGAVAGLVCIMQDISQRKLYEHRLELSNQILNRLNQHKDSQKTIKSILTLIKESLSIDAVGIRLKDGNDYPYFATNGFTDTFIQTENSLCTTHEEGHCVHDADETPILECMCGSVLQGRTDPFQPFFTNFGSFWTNSTKDLAASASEEFQQHKTREAFHKGGYESVALVPLKAGDGIIGLMQLNHQKSNFFTLELIHFFENLGGSIGIALDRMKTQKMIEESEIRYRELININIDAIVVIDQAGIVRYINPASINLFGRDKIDLLGKPFNYPISPNTITEIDIVKQNGTTTTGEMRIAETEWLGELISIATIRDITYQKINEKEKKELEGQLQQAQKMESIGTLAGGIAHDFNNILSAIIGFSELAMDQVDTDNAIRDDLSEILNAGNRARELVSQILSFSRQTNHEPTPVHTETIIKEVVQLIRSTLPATISIETSIEASGEIMADPIRIHQVLMNLCTNAYHAMHDTGGVLSIRLNTISIPTNGTLPIPNMLPGNYVKITITDTGTGIAPEIIPLIFDPYFTTKGQGEGTGLGLAVTHGVVTSHNGHIVVESETGRGTSFHIYFPCIKCEQKKSVNKSSQTERLMGTERILFVDDELPILKVNKIMLERLGYHVTTINNSQEALALFRAQPNNFDLIITDMTMPKTTGEVLAKECLRVREDMPIIMCTGYSDIISEAKAQEIGIREYVMKPILMKNLAQAIRKALGE